MQSDTISKSFTRTRDFLCHLSSQPINEHHLAMVQTAMESPDAEAIPRVPSAGEISFDETHEVFIQTMHNGLRMVRDGYYGPWMTELIKANRGLHEPQEEKVFQEVLRRIDEAGGGNAMVEFGSYWAYYSLWFRKKFPDSVALMVEPDPNCRSVGELNFRINEEKGIFVDACVGGEVSPAVEFHCQSDQTVRICPRVTLDALIESHSLETVDILLADIQGAEVAMLDGMKSAIEQNQLRGVFVSTHSSEISGDPLTHQKVLDQLDNWGAEILAEHSVDESYSCDGLIAATFDKQLSGKIQISLYHAKPSLIDEYECALTEFRKAHKTQRDQIDKLSLRISTLRQRIKKMRKRKSAQLSGKQLLARLLKIIRGRLTFGDARKTNQHD